MNYGYPKIQSYIRISIIRLMDILKSIYGYAKIGLYCRIGLTIIHLRISLNHDEKYIKEIGKISKN